MRNEISPPYIQISIALFYRKVLCNLPEMPFSEILIIL